MHDTKVHDSLNICNCMLKYMQIHTNPKCTSSYSHFQSKSVRNLGFENGNHLTFAIVKTTFIIMPCLVQMCMFVSPSWYNG